MLRAMGLCLVAVVVTVAAASATLTPVPIEGKLLVSGVDDSGLPVSYYMDGSSDALVSTLTFFSKGALSPDATRVAYNALTGGSWQIGTGDVWVGNLDSSGEVNLTPSLGGVNCTPKWSPDGKTILFQHAQLASGKMTCESGWTMWLVEADGSNLRQCAPVGLSLGPWPYLGWAADGYHLTGISTTGYFITDITGSTVTPLPLLQGSSNWCNDGSRLVSDIMVPGLAGDPPGVWRRLTLAGADGSNPQVLVEQFIADSDVEAHIALYNPTGYDWVSGIRAQAGPILARWSPMGDQVAFSAALPFDPDGPWVLFQREVWLYDLGTQQLVQLTQDSALEDYLSWAGPNTTAASATVTVYDNSVTFAQVDEDGWTYIVRRDDVPALPATYQAIGNTQELGTSAQVTGPAEVSMAYDAAAVPDTAEGHLKLLRYDEGAAGWQDITSSRDLTNHVIKGSTTTLGLMQLSWPLPESDFADVPDAADNPYWALWEIQAAADAGIVQGYADGYHPERTVDRASMAVYIARALAGGEANVPPNPSAVSFPDDVPNTHWAYKYVEYAVGAGVVQGYDATHYRPDTIVTRDQMTVFVARAKQWVHLGDDMSTAPELFSDVPAGFWCGTAVQACVEHHVVQGYADGTYHPEREVTRDQMAVYVARAFELL